MKINEFLGQLDIVRLLIANGANVNVIDSGGHTPLHVGAANGEFSKL